MRKNHKIRPSTREENYDRVYIDRADIPDVRYFVNHPLKTVYINIAAFPMSTTLEMDEEWEPMA